MEQPIRGAKASRAGPHAGCPAARSRTDRRLARFARGISGCWFLSYTEPCASAPVVEPGMWARTQSPTRTLSLTIIRTSSSLPNI